MWISGAILHFACMMGRGTRLWSRTRAQPGHRLCPRCHQGPYPSAHPQQVHGTHCRHDPWPGSGAELPPRGVPRGGWSTTSGLLVRVGSFVTTDNKSNGRWPGGCTRAEYSLMAAPDFGSSAVGCTRHGPVVQTCSLHARWAGARGCGAERGLNRGIGCVHAITKVPTRVPIHNKSIENTVDTIRGPVPVLSSPLEGCRKGAGPQPVDSS